MTAIRMIQRRMFRSATVLFFLLSLFPLAKAGSAELKKISVVFHWKAQAQWAGFYMAKEKGIYERHGLDVDLMVRRGRSDPLDLLMDGRVTFATHFLSGGIGLRSAVQPVVLISQIINRSNLMLVARHSDGVNKITDLSGKAVSFWDGYYRFIFKSFFKNQGVTNLREQPMGLTVTQFTSKQVAAASAMEYNEYNLIRNSPNVNPNDLVVFRLRDMGMDFPEDAIYTTEKLAEEQPETCRAFVKATLEGWEYARDNREESMIVIMRAIANDPDVLVTEEHQRWMLDHILDSVFIPKELSRKLGVLSRADFDAMHKFLNDNGQLRQPVEYDDFVKFHAFEPMP